jgi:pimeloyl-ACP methyl ester carboxylesterase
MACTAGTLTDPEIETIYRAHAEGRPEAQLFARVIHPACGERMAREQPALHFLYREMYALSLDLDKDAVRRKLNKMRTTPRAAVAALRMPVLCITGQEDVVIPPAVVAVLTSIVPGARLAGVPETGHSVYWERPATFNRLVDEFLADAEAR